MKTKFLFLLAGMAFSAISSAQTSPYHSYFGNEFTHWYTYNSWYDIGYSDLYSVEEGDTILSNNSSYKKLYNT